VYIDECLSTHRISSKCLSVAIDLFRNPLIAQQQLKAAVEQDEHLLFKNGARCTRLRCSTCSSHRSILRKTGADQSIASSLLNDICMSEHIILRAFLLSVMEDIFGKKKFEKKSQTNCSPGGAS